MTMSRMLAISLYLLAARNAIALSILDNLVITFNDSNVDLAGDVGFFLYTRLNKEEPQRLWVDNKTSLDTSHFDISKPTKFMTHGWLNTYQGNNCITVRRAFLAHDDYNVIVVDWGNVAKLPFLEAAARIKAVGGYVAKMIGFLASQGNELNNMSLVGHSLGAHMMGLAGYQATNKVAHVVGLDPGLPGFKTAGPGFGISSEDGTFVEIIHTNAGGLGLVAPVGDADYYPNGGGIQQPGCEKDENVYCAHDRAFVFYAEALTRPDSLLARRCESYDKFLKGECDNNQVVAFPRWTAEGNKPKGSFYLRTASQSPFGLGEAGTKA